MKCVPFEAKVGCLRQIEQSGNFARQPIVRPANDGFISKRPASRASRLPSAGCQFVTQTATLSCNSNFKRQQQQLQLQLQQRFARPHLNAFVRLRGANAHREHANGRVRYLDFGSHGDALQTGSDFALLICVCRLVEFSRRTSQGRNLKSRRRVWGHKKALVLRSQLWLSFLYLSSFLSARDA